MPERIKIIVRASGAHPDVLTIEDAMSRVLDIFEMLENMPGVQWKLVSASTNSPLQVEAEAISLEASVDVSVIARSQKQKLARQLHELLRGQLPDDPGFKPQPAKRFLQRNLNGVGATEIDLDGHEQIAITPLVRAPQFSCLRSPPLVCLMRP